MTCEELEQLELVKDVLDHTTLGFPFKGWKVSFRLCHEGGAGIFIMLSGAQIPDRDSGEPKRLALTSETFPIKSFKTRHEVLAVVRKLTVGFMCHEANEAIIFDGTRPFDPHQEKECQKS